MNGWEKWHGWNAETMAPVTNWFVEAIRPRPGTVLLDVGCGTGIPSLALAERLGPRGRMLATDRSPEMLGAARRIAAASGAGNIEHREMDMASLALPDESFGGASAAFCLMFAPEPLLAIRELTRVVQRGAPVAVAVWDEPARNPWAAAMLEPLARFAPAPPQSPGPGPFSLSAAGRLEDLLRAAGLRDVAVVSRELSFDFDSVERHWEIMSDMVAPLRAAAASLPPAELSRLKTTIAERLQPFLEGGRASIPGAARCGVGFR